jgi:DNA-binding MarR family transcriptional regulator
MVTSSKNGFVLEAQELDRDLRAIREFLRQPVESEIARGGLTGPQVALVQILVNTGPLSVKELSRQAGLAHSTVSGIVDRLEQRGVLQRNADQHDARFTRIALSAEVERYMQHTLPTLTRHPLADALRRARPADRTLILTGIRTLRRLLESGDLPHSDRSAITGSTRVARRAGK